MSTKRPNVLLVVLDCARSDRWVGDRRTSQTPVMDRLVSEGVSLPTTIVERSCTTPAFASLMTGTYSYQHGVWGLGGYRLLDDLPTLPEVLRAAGYRTYAEMTGPMVPVTGCDRGFGEYGYRAAYDFMHTRWGELFCERLRTGAFHEPWFLMLHLWELHTPRQITPAFDSPAYGENTYDRSASSLDAQLGRIVELLPANTLTVVTGDHGEKTLDETYRKGTAVDYALKLYHIDDHRGLKMGQATRLIGPVALHQLRAYMQPMLERFSLQDSPRAFDFSRRTYLRDLLRIYRLAPLLRFKDYLVLRTPVKLTRLMEKRGVLDPDRNRRRVARLVDKVGLDRLFDMYLRMWAGQFHIQLREGHILHVYDYLARVPWVLHWPEGLPAGVTRDRMVRQVDIPATILDLVGVEAPESFSPEGQSAGPLIRGEPWAPRPAFLSVGAVPRDLALRGVRTEGYKYTYGPENPEMPRELYDLRADPDELSNLAADCPDRCSELQALADGMIPPEGPRVGRIEGLSAQEQREMELRMRDLGYLG